MRDDDFLGPNPTGWLHVHQRLPTSGARAAHVFELEGGPWLAVPQLAQDVSGQPAHMNGGDSDVDALLFRWQDGAFVPDARLPCPGGEDALSFGLDGTTWLAFANLRTGRGPYETNTRSLFYRRVAGRWEPAASLPTFAAKQWHAFAIDGRRFLALAQGLTLPQYVPSGHGRSVVYEWRDGGWQEFQVLGGRWGYNWCDFALGGERFLGYADHVSPSVLYRWDGARFLPYQTFGEQGGRAFRHFVQDGQDWLAFASISGASALYRWNGELFQVHQSLGGPGGREFELVRRDDRLFLVRICFIEGTPAAPRTELNSQLYEWRAGRFEVVEEFPTHGGTDVAHFRDGDTDYLVVTNSLTAELRFRQDSVVYRLEPAAGG